MAVIDAATLENTVVAADITRRQTAGLSSEQATNLAIRQHANDRGIDPVSAHIKLIKQGAVTASTFRGN